MIQAVRNAFTLPDLRRKIFFTFFILFVYRAAAHVPVPGVDQEALRGFLVGGQAGSQIFGFLDLISGGALSNFSVMAMGVYPYITASIIMQLLQPIIPQLEEIAREPGGRDKLNQYTHWLMVPLAALQGYGQAIFIQRSVGANVLANFGFNVDPLGTVSTILTMTAGTVFAKMWVASCCVRTTLGCWFLPSSQRPRWLSSLLFRRGRGVSQFSTVSECEVRAFTVGRAHTSRCASTVPA